VTATVRILGTAAEQVARGAFRLAAERKSIEVANQARRNCPVDHGRLRGSITFAEISPNEFRVGSNVDYALHVEQGTGIYGPHGTPIVPVTKKFLRFKPRGSSVFVFTKSVKGMRPTRYLSKALATVFGRG
jgi:hypothetical protein